MTGNNLVPELRSLTKNHNSPLAVIVCLLLGLLLSACEGAVTPQPSGSVISEVQTAVAETVTAEATPTTIPTATPLLTSTPPPTPHLPPTAIPPTPTSPIYFAYVTSYGCDDSAYIKDITIPDGTVLAPGEAFVKTWRFQNTGTCTWDSHFQLVFTGGRRMHGSDAQIHEKVTANKKANVSVELTAPAKDGIYTGYWQLADQYGNTFGDQVYVQIDVSAQVETSTPTPTSTGTPLPTFTSTPTPTLEPTDTPTPTPYPTETPTSTATPLPTFTSTPTPTYLAPPTSTIAPTGVPTATGTFTPTVTPSSTPGSVPTDTPLPTNTRTPFPTHDK